ncbi:MAG: glycosyltransferase [Thermodesulfobacteriota bacterium]|nr:glycosyltransferase [Thermodesulfobacteriota bacterium]
MRICMFTNTYLPHVGGVARSVSILTRDLQKLGHRVLVIAPEFQDNNHRDADDHVIRLPAIQNFNGSDFSVSVPMPFILKEAVSEFQPDIIHSHHPFLLGDSALRAARNYQLPMVFTHHTLYEQYTHYVPFDSDVMKRFVIKLTTQYANMCNRIIAPSQSIAELIISRGVRRPIEPIPTGVDTAFFKEGNGQGFRETLGIPRDAFVIGHLGRLAPEKNLSYLAQAVAGCLTQHPQAFFLVVGDGPSKKEMQQIFDTENVGSRAIFAGKKAGNDLRNAYKAMDLFVFSSKSETQGMVLAEAMASGLPVVALDASGAREVVKDGKNGRLLPGDANIETFTTAVSDIMTEPQTMNTYADNASRTAEDFARDICAERVVNLYKSAMAHYHTDEDKEPIDIISWERFLGRINTEWDLISQKTRAIVDAVVPDKP